MRKETVSPGDEHSQGLPPYLSHVGTSRGNDSYRIVCCIPSTHLPYNWKFVPFNHLPPTFRTLRPLPSRNMHHWGARVTTGPEPSDLTVLVTTYPTRFFWKVRDICEPFGCP